MLSDANRKRERAIKYKSKQGMVCTRHKNKRLPEEFQKYIADIIDWVSSLMLVPSTLHNP